MSVVTCCHTCHIDHKTVMMKMNLVDITDKMFEVSRINSSRINPKNFGQYDHQITDNKNTIEELSLSGYDLEAE